MFDHIANRPTGGRLVEKYDFRPAAIACASATAFAYLTILPDAALDFRSA
jgi:hypothetical protein